MGLNSTSSKPAELWPDLIIMQIPLIHGKYNYLCGVNSLDCFKIYYLIENERQARDEILEYLHPIDHERDIFVDIGGYIGSWTLPMTAVNPKTVYVFEPSTRYAANIETQININNTISRNKFGDRVKIISTALGDRYMNKISINDLRAGVWYDYHLHGITNTDDKTIDVITFDDFISRYNVKANDIRLIKIDIEGWELNVLNGMIKFLSMNRPELIIECHEHIMDHDEDKYLEPSITANLAQFGYKIKKMWDNLYWYSTH